MAYEGRRADTVHRHRLSGSRGTAQEHDEAVAVRYCSIKQARSLGMIGQIEERGAELHELCFLFFRQNDVFEMSCGGIQFRTLHQFINFRIEAYDKI